MNQYDCQAEHIISSGNRIYAQIDKVNACVTECTCSIAIQLKTPPIYDSAESVCKHPQQQEGEEHNVTFSNDLATNHTKIK